MTATRKMPWCVGWYRLDFCREKAAELRKTGRYVRVWVASGRKKEFCPDARQVETYARVWVETEVSP